MPVLSSDLVSNCPNSERLELEFGSYRWSPYITKGNTEGSLKELSFNDPVTTDSEEDEIEISHADPLLCNKFNNKGESIVYPSSNRRSGENAKRKLFLSKVIGSIVPMS